MHGLGQSINVVCYYPCAIIETKRLKRKKKNRMQQEICYL